MSENTPFGFAKLVPGFDFLQNLAKGASQSAPQMPSLSSWVAPTINVEELDKRIGELKAVHYWLDQNSKALGATIQALEVQKMTLATLQGMNFKMADLANSLKLKPQAVPEAAKPVQDAKPAKDGKAGTGAGAAVDPLQWWGALTEQFQQIAADAMKDVAHKAAVEPQRKPAAQASNDPMKAAAGTAKAPARAPAAPKKAAARKAPRKKPSKS
jgi:hypothetical protein